MAEYKVIFGSLVAESGWFSSSGGMEAFTKEVNEHLADGWVCQGGINASTMDNKNRLLFQAMVKNP